MFRVRFVCLLLAICLALGITGSVLAAEVDCDTTYCFTSQDFSSEDAPLAGICITQLPDPETGTVMLGSRVIHAGDILTADQVNQMTFSPLRTQVDTEAVVTYLPIYTDHVAKSATTAISIRGKIDQAPAAADSSMETYKNLPNEGRLKVSDPEGGQLVYTLLRNPKRGTVELREDGTFLYTPKKNKVGVDSFTFTATDSAGNVSREATVTIQIIKPTDTKQYTDTVGHPCRFAAEWMRNTGLFVGEKVSGQECFHPEKAVSRGEFLAMVVDVLQIPTENVSYADIPTDTPAWLKPYFAAALRSGLTAGLPEEKDPYSPITGAEAAVMLQNALDLTVSQEALESVSTVHSEDIPTWAAASLTVMNENGIALDASQTLNRGDTAQLLYQVSYLAVNAPGTAVFRMQS